MKADNLIKLVLSQKEFHFQRIKAFWGVGWGGCFLKIYLIKIPGWHLVYASKAL